MGIIAERITKARKELGLNQKELAKKANLTEANLSRYENGIREPKSAVLARLADALFFYKEDTKKPLESFVDKLQTVVFQAKESKRLTAADNEIEDLVKELIANHTIG